MLKLCVLAAAFLAVVFCAPLENSAPEEVAHKRVKRTGDEADLPSQENIQPEVVKQADVDLSAMANSEVEEAEDAPSQPDVMQDATEEKPADLLMPPEPQSQSKEKEPVAMEEDGEKEEEEVKNGQVQADEGDASGPREGNEKIEETDEDVEDLNAFEPAAAAAEGNKDKSAAGAQLLPANYKGRNLYMFDPFYPVGSERWRRAARRHAVKAEDMVMGEEDETSADTVSNANAGRRTKRDLSMDELRNLILDENYAYADYPDYVTKDYPSSEDYYQYSDNEEPEFEPDWEDEERMRMAIVEEDIANLLAEKIAQEREREREGRYPEYADYSALDLPPEEEEEEYYEEQFPVYAQYEYPDVEEVGRGGDGLTMREKLALTEDMERNIMNAEGYPYPADVKETYQDLGPVADPLPPPSVYKRQYLSFVPGVKRGISPWAVGEGFYPTGGESWWRGFITREEKRNSDEYQRLLRLAAALNPPPENYYLDEYKKK